MKAQPPAMAGLLGKRLGMTLLVDLLLDTPLYLTTAAVDIDASGRTYTGGRKLSVDAVKSSAGTVDNLALTLSGVPSEYIALALGTAILGKRLLLSAAFLHPDTQAVVWVDPLWSGALDQMPIKQSGEQAAVSITAEHRGIVFARPKGERYTDASQRRLHGADRCLEYLNSQAQHADIWPSAEFFRR